MLSRINIFKGQENLIKLLADKKNNLQRFKFFIIGSGEKNTLIN